MATFISLLRGNKLELVCLLDTFTDQSAQSRLNNMVAKQIIKENNILFYHDVIQSDYADIEDLFLKSDYVDLYNKTFDVEIDSATLTDGSILEQLRALNNGESFNHYRPANYLAKNIQSISFSKESLDNFEKLFKMINKLF